MCVCIYKSCIRSLLDYTDVIYDNCFKFDTDKLEHVQRRACIIATRSIRLTKHETPLQEVGLETIKFRRYHRLLYLQREREREYCLVLSCIVLSFLFINLCSFVLFTRCYCNYLCCGELLVASGCMLFS